MTTFYPFAATSFIVEAGPASYTEDRSGIRLDSTAVNQSSGAYIRDADKSATDGNKL
jgi:hypothetical protein